MKDLIIFTDKGIELRQINKEEKKELFAIILKDLEKRKFSKECRYTYVPLHFNGNFITYTYDNYAERFKECDYLN